MPAWQQTSAVRPAASRLPNGSRHSSAVFKPAHANNTYAKITDAGPDEPELLADDGEDHVGVRLGQVVDLLHALAEPLAEEVARAEADLRLDDLEPGPLRVLPRIEEAEQRAHACTPCS